MALTSILGFELLDLEANQRGHLSNRQYQMLLGRVVRAFEHLSHPLRVEQFTGLVMIDEYQPSDKGDREFHLWIGGMEVVLELLGSSTVEVSKVFDAGHIYTAYCVECDGRKLLLSVEEGPDWQGNTAGTVSTK